MRDLRALLDEELTFLDAPPMGDLVERSIQQGTQIRRQHRVRIASSIAGAVVIAAAAVAVAAGDPLRGTGGAARVAAPAPAPTVSAPATVVNPTPSAGGPPPGIQASVHEDLRIPGLRTAPRGTRAKATPAAMLELITRLLPPGQTSEARKVSDGQLSVQIYLNRGQGPGMLRISLYEHERGEKECVAGYRCYPVPGGGALTVTGTHGNCIQEDIVQLARPDGLFIMVNLASCLMGNGSGTAVGSKALTTQEAVDLVLDPRWGMTMPTEIVEAGARKFPNLREFG